MKLHNNDNIEVNLNKHVSTFSLKDTELEFLESYEQIMKPLAQALDILQGGKNTLFGFLVPTLERLKEKLQKRQTQLIEKRSVCIPLMNALLDGITMRFSEVLTDPKAIAAAILIPSLKDLWTENKDILEIGW
jgi:hypothetical protein